MNEEIFFKYNNEYYCFSKKEVIILKIDTVIKHNSNDFFHIKITGEKITRKHYDQQTNRVLNKIRSRVTEFMEERDKRYMELTQLKIFKE